MSQPESAERTQKVFKALFITVGTLFAIGVISIIISVFTSGGKQQAAAPAEEINYKEVSRSAKAKESHDRDLAKWYTDGVSSVCRSGRIKFPALEFGAAGRVPDMAQAMAMFMKDLREVAPPKAVDNQATVKAELDRGNGLEMKWAELAKQPGPTNQPAQYAAVDEVRNYLQDLINKGASNEDCGAGKMLPRPNPPMNPVPPAQ